MKHRAHSVLACLIGMLFVTSMASADILVTGDTWARTWGPAISVDATWFASHAWSWAKDEAYYGYGGENPDNFTYTTETGTFSWDSYLYVKAMAHVKLYSGETVDAYAYAWAMVYGPAENHLSNLIEAEVSLSEAGYNGDYIPDYDEPHPWGLATTYEEDVTIEAMDGVQCAHFSWADASIPQGEEDEAWAEAWAVAAGDID